MRFYFHLYNGSHVPDLEGNEQPDLPTAKEWAMSQARMLFATMAKEQGRVVLSHRIDIKDERCRILGTVRLGDAVNIES